MQTEAFYEDQARSLLLDHACRKIATHLSAAEHEFVMLKGATIADWLYETPTARTYLDLDVLVSPGSEAAVVEALGHLGFEPLLDPSTRRILSPEEQPLRDRFGVVVDLHVGLKGVHRDPEAAWEILKSETITVNWAGTAVPALAPPARAMHLALHLAQSGLADEKAAVDLQLGLDRLELATWRDAASLADRLDAGEAFAAGLMLLPAGVDLAGRLSLATPTHVETQMRAIAASNSAVALERTLASASWRERVQLIRAQLFPSRRWMQTYQPAETGSRGRLLRARVLRPLQILVRLPSALLERRSHRRRLRKAGQ